jgi:hypothetical protein
MKFSFAVVIAVTTILSIADPVIGGGIRGRYLEDEDDEENNECRNTSGRIQTGGQHNFLLNCKQIAKAEMCAHEQHPPNGEFLYDLCRSACNVCLEGAIEITDPPTESLLELVFTEFPTDAIDDSASPTDLVTIATSRSPTASPSVYPTVSPTTESPTLISMNQGGGGGEITISPTIDPILDPNYGYNETTVPLNDIDGLPEEIDSAAPTLSPIMIFTNTPTPAPSLYPTISPTVISFTDAFEDLDDDLLLGIN